MVQAIFDVEKNEIELWVDENRKIDLFNGRQEDLTLFKEDSPWDVITLRHKDCQETKNIIDHAA